MVLLNLDYISPVEVSRASNGHKTIGVGQFGEDSNLIVVLEGRPHHRHASLG